MAAHYDVLFRTGTVPDPVPDGFLPGDLEMTTTRGPIDAYVRFATGIWMPWLGKRFDASTSTGVNRMVPGARLPLRALWPRHEPRAADGTLEVFPFRTRVEPGALDPETTVLVIDYDFEANPSFIIRRIRDELVQIDDGFYLGKVLMRVGPRHHAVGFFSLRRA